MQADLILADFGCARALKRTAHGAWGSLPDDDGGTLAFTPPEAFEERVQVRVRVRVRVRVGVRVRLRVRVRVRV